MPRRKEPPHTGVCGDTWHCSWRCWVRQARLKKRRKKGGGSVTLSTSPANIRCAFTLCCLEMGASTSSSAAAPGSGLVTVSKRNAPASQVDPDLAALRSLPQAAPLVKQPTLRGLLFPIGSSRRAADAGLPELNPRNVSALCREFASISRQAALPVCEEQRVIAKKMSAVEALCARVLYLMALRTTELNSSTATLRDIGSVAEAIRASRLAYNNCVARAAALERILPSFLDEPSDVDAQPQDVQDG